MKIGLITIYHVPNYGSVLQTFATQELLKSMGHDVKIIRYNYFNKRYYEELGYGPSLREKFYPLKSLVMPKCKAAVLERFRNKNLHFTKAFNSIEDMYQSDWSDYDAFVVGSDQVWNTNFLLGDPCFLLSFVPQNKKRFALSSSFATRRVAEKYVDVFRNELEKFSAISVRENNGKDIIHEQLGLNKDVEITLDPTLLLNKSQWLKLFPLHNVKRHKPYILYYMWAYAFEPRPYIYHVVKYFQDKMSCDVIALEGIRDSKDCKEIQFIDADNSTIPEFMELFANASLIITSSFHGTAFALNFGIPLVSIIPNNQEDDRQSTLLKACGAYNSIVKISTAPQHIDPLFDRSEVEEKLDKIRQNSLIWIKNNIK